MERPPSEVRESGERAQVPHVQPRVVGTDLREFEGSAPAEHLARLEADQQLMLRLSVAGFTGSAWEHVARALVEYGRTVMFAWIVTGMVFVKCHEKGIVPASFAGPRHRIAGADAEELTEDTVANAIISFRDGVLRRGRWDPAKGASLATFFIGNCLLRFPNVYREWRREQTRRARLDGLDRLEGHPSGLSTATQAIGSAEADRVLAELPDGDRTVAFLLGHRFNVPEIATLTGQSVKAVEARVYRLRRRMRRDGHATT